jgi:hypothetical protein
MADNIMGLANKFFPTKAADFHKGLIAVLYLAPEVG